ncbi:hypothetical protein CRG98_018583 [Punica granatum]|uniref:Uncharacterized protein n=1 Tax=Punica granatum TaxID=22663 RepID=A0A2I0JXJ4_PUNGR|nr:hypothetical protein CRG98_018583 [Punica granatum]
MGLRHVISYAFNRSKTVAKPTFARCWPFSLALNGVKIFLSGVAVGCGWQRFVAYVDVGCYYIVRVPLGYLLGFKFHIGGIWSGMISGTVMQAPILLWVTFRTDWNREVEKAKERLDKWEDKKKAPL